MYLLQKAGAKIPGHEPLYVHLAVSRSLASRYCKGYSFWVTYLRTLSLRFQKAPNTPETVTSQYLDV